MISLAPVLPQTIVAGPELIPPFTIEPPAGPRKPAAAINPDPFVPAAMASKYTTARPQSPLAEDRNTLRLSDSSLSFSPASLRPSLFTNSQPVTAPSISFSRPVAKTTEQKIEEFYGVKQLGTEVLFTSKFESARQVLVAGDFNNWSPMVTPMHRNDRPGEWTMKLPLMPGRYRYRLVVDGRWMTDPHNKYVEVNQFGELNNIVEVE
jgi:hypothetical protein